MISTFKNRDHSFIFFAGLFILFLIISVITELYYLAAIPFAFLFFYAGWQAFYFIFFLLLFSLPFSAEYQFTDMLGTDFPDELLMFLTSTFFVCYFIYKPGVLAKRIRTHPLIILLLLSLCWSLISVVFSTQLLVSFKYLLAKSWYIGAFVLAPLIVFSEKKMIKRGIAALVVAMLLVMLITLVRHYQYGFSFASINNALQPFFRNHVNYSAMLVCIIPIVFVYWQSLQKSKTKFLAGAIVIILLVALYFSYARGAWLALIAGIVAAWLIKKRLLAFTYITVIIIVISSVFWIKNNDRYLKYANDYKTTIWHENFSEHITATYQLKDVSTAERFYRWIAGVRMIEDNPMTGYGPNSFYYNYRPYTIPAFKTWVSDNREHSTVHNYFLLVAIEQGIPGLIFFLLLTTTLLFYAQHLYHRIEDKFYKSAAITTGVILTMILTVNFLSDLIETDKIGSLFFLCLSVLVVTDINSRRLNSLPDVQSVS